MLTEEAWSKDTHEDLHMKPETEIKLRQLQAKEHQLFPTTTTSTSNNSWIYNEQLIPMSMKTSRTEK